MNDEPKATKRLSLAAELAGVAGAIAEKASTIGSQANNLEELLRGTSTPYDAPEEKKSEPKGLLPTLIEVSRSTANTLTRASKILADLILDVQAE